MERRGWNEQNLGAMVKDMVHGSLPPQRGIDVVLDPNPPPRRVVGFAGSDADRKAHARETLRYIDMQQRARLLVPLYPVHSRLDDVERVRQEMVRVEDHRDAHGRLRELDDQLRAERTRKAWSLTRTPAVARQVAQHLKQSSMQPLASAHPLGADTAPAALLSRKVDFNSLRRERARTTKSLRQTRIDKLADVAARYDEFASDIENFERSCPWTVETKDAAGHTAHDWTGTREPRRRCSGRLRRVDSDLGATAASGLSPAAACTAAEPLPEAPEVRPRSSSPSPRPAPTVSLAASGRGAAAAFVSGSSTSVSAIVANAASVRQCQRPRPRSPKAHSGGGAASATVRREAASDYAHTPAPLARASAPALLSAPARSGPKPLSRPPPQQPAASEHNAQVTSGVSEVSMAADGTGEVARHCLAEACDTLPQPRDDSRAAPTSDGDVGAIDDPFVVSMSKLVTTLKF
eukprot:TRINITY_DN30601_c0_g1_i1.p1 TRINITY_DN30601_c0_g1~~TRINITY_DN30601_c0_g1_i1.p1  ORF type:complete len:463 (+),score=66.83 TRINITY_DN30601_c0_g1_i1:66-1454(+)